MTGDTVAETWYNTNASWINGLLITLAVQAVIGVIAIEYAFLRLKRFKNIDEERDSRFPAFRRRDAHLWSKWKFYPGALLSMPFRLCFMIF